MQCLSILSTVLANRTLLGKVALWHVMPGRAGGGFPGRGTSTHWWEHYSGEYMMAVCLCPYKEEAFK